MNVKDLAAPGDERSFIEQLWCKKSFLIKGDSRKFSDLFSLDKFYAAVESGQQKKPEGYRLAKFVSPNPLVKTMTSEVIGLRDISEAIDEGSTICVTHLELCDDGLFEMANALKHELNYLGDVQINCYLSPEGSGASLHFDARLGMIVQIEGEKMWKYGEVPCVEWPLSNAQLNSENKAVWVSPFAGTAAWEQLPDVNPDGLKDVLLQPGDLLCLPAGTWHSAKASGYSLALNIAFRPLNYFNIILKLIYDRFQDNPDWRGGPIPFPGSIDNPADNNKIIADWNDKFSSLSQFIEALQKDNKMYSDLYNH